MTIREWWRSAGARPREKVVYVARERLPAAAIAGILAVPDTDPWWRAVQQVIDDLEAETIKTARDLTGEPALCATAVAAGEALDMLRRRLCGLREEGIKGAAPQ